jgi:UDPglucose 6-dehydrogenase
MARSIGVEPTLAEATDTINRRQVSRLANIILSHLPAGGKVGILGLSYKPDTNIVEESQGLELACMLLKKEIQVVLYDPLALDNARKVLGDKPIFAPSLQACTQQADVLVVTTPWPEFKNIQLADLVRNPKRPVVLDCWRILDGAQINQVADYVTLGTGEN